MGIFSRLGEIINSNISSMLDKAENPDKMVRLMIHEMEDTLTEIKSSAAEVIADRIRTQRRLNEAKGQLTEWEGKAELAVIKDRDDLARIALERKITCEKQVTEASANLANLDDMVTQYQQDIERLEEKLQGAYRRQKELNLKKKRAEQSLKVEERINKASRTAFEKFEEYADRIDRMEAEAEIQKHTKDYDREFHELSENGDIESELKKLKERALRKKELES